MRPPVCGICGRRVLRVDEDGACDNCEPRPPACDTCGDTRTVGDPNGPTNGIYDVVDCPDCVIRTWHDPACKVFACLMVGFHAEVD